MKSLTFSRAAPAMTKGGLKLRKGDNSGDFPGGNYDYTLPEAIAE
jgi:hypothetical protein